MPREDTYPTMAFGSLLLLLDDIAVLMDDVAVMTKLATKKTAGVLGDDLALNAEQVSGVVAERELPVVWAVAKGSAVNKAILVPAALLISAVYAPAIKVLLMLGGCLLCYEGFEKVWEKLTHHAGPRPVEARLENVQKPVGTAAEQEQAKIKGAVRTDFILSAEIVVIALGSFADKPLRSQIAALVFFSVLMTVGVYGLVALVVKLDDIGLRLRLQGGVRARLGDAIVRGAPYLMKTLGVVGTAAMFLVGGGLLVHTWPAAEGALLAWSASLGAVGSVVPTLVNGLAGVLAGALIVAAASVGRRVTGRAKAA
jgi:predicted DNA repair protein MutK